MPTISEGGEWEPPATAAVPAIPERPGMTGTAHPRERMTEMLTLEQIRVVPWNFPPLTLSGAVFL